LNRQSQLLVKSIMLLHNLSLNFKLIIFLEIMCGCYQLVQSSITVSSIDNIILMATQPTAYLFNVKVISRTIVDNYLPDCNWKP